MCFLSTTFPNAPAHPPPLYFLTSPLMRSFFDGEINGHTSEWKTMTSGCPQDTAFAPLLWKMFQNDIAYQVNVNPHHVR